MRLFLSFRSNIFMLGLETGEQRIREAIGLPDPQVQKAQQERPTPKLSAKIRTPASLIFERYELLFDLDIAGYLSSGIVAAGWVQLVDRIKELVDSKFNEFPVGTNTVIVRSIQVHRNGEGEFILEPLHNSELDVKEQPGDNNAS